MTSRWPLAPLAAIVGLQAFLLSRELHLPTVSDEANYVLSVHAMQHGEALGRQIFISQPPGFFVWLRWLAVPFGNSVHDARLAMIVTVAIATIALYVLGREIAGPVGGLAAAGLLTITTPLAIEGAQVYSDTPALAFGAVALALAAVRRPALAGIFLTASISCKLSGVIAVPPLAALLWTRSSNPSRALARCAAGALALGALLTLVFVRDIAQIYDGVVNYHVASYNFNGFSAQHRLHNWVSVDSPYFWFVVIGAGATIVRARRLWPLWLWPAAALVFLFWQKPLHDNHMLVLPYTFAAAAGPSVATLLDGLKPRLALTLATAGVVAAAGGFVQQLHWVDRQPHGEDPGVVFEAEQLSSVTRPGDLIVTDQGIVALLAHRRLPGALADSSVMRFAAPTLTPADVERIIEAQPVTAVLAGRAFIIPELAPTFLPFFRRTFAHELKLPGPAYLFYGKLGSSS